MTLPRQHSSVLPQIKHVVVLMMENRSFDNLLGFLYADQGNQPARNIPPQDPPTYDGLAAGRFSNRLSSSSPPVFASEGANTFVVPRPDPKEDFDDMTRQIFGSPPAGSADMSGFLADYATANPSSPDQIMQSYSPEQVPVISAIAKDFALSDRWFASAPCQTWPNRGFVHTGSSDGHINNDDYELYDIETIFNLLKKQGISWEVYNDTVLPSLVHLMFPKLWLELNHFHGMEPFYRACGASEPADRLPAYTFLEPDFKDPDESYHPPHDVRPGEKFLARVYGALQQSPYRDDILFVITFDENGGCYDHVPPPGGAEPPEPRAVSRDGDFHFDRFGVRVPAIVVSSYVAPGTVFRAAGDVPYDHTSILATLRDWLGISQSVFEQTLPSPRIAAAPTLAGVLDQSTPRPWPEVPIPEVDLPPVSDDEPVDPLQMSIVAGTTSLHAGRHIGSEAVGELRRKIKTIGHARAHLASLGSSRKGRRSP